MVGVAGQPMDHVGATVEKRELDIAVTERETERSAVRIQNHEP